MKNYFVTYFYAVTDIDARVEETVCADLGVVADVGVTEKFCTVADLGVFRNNYVRTDLNILTDFSCFVDTAVG